MNIILWILFGGLAGWVATLIVGDDGAFGIIGNVVIGILGAFLGGWIAGNVSDFGTESERPTSFASFLWAVVGAVVLLLLLQLLF